MKKINMEDTELKNLNSENITDVVELESVIDVQLELFKNELLHDLKNNTTFNIIENKLLTSADMDTKRVVYFSEFLQATVRIFLDDKINTMTVKVKLGGKFKKISFKTIRINVMDFFDNNKRFAEEDKLGLSIDFKEIRKTPKTMINFMGAANSFYREELTKEVSELTFYWIHTLLKYLNTDLCDNMYLAIALDKFGIKNTDEFNQKAISLKSKLMKEVDDRMAGFPEFEPVMKMASIIEKQNSNKDFKNVFSKHKK